MERIDRPTVAAFYSPDPLGAVTAGASVALGEEAAHHARVKRIDVGTRVQLLDGAGCTALGTLVRLARQQLVVELDEVTHHDPLPPVHMIVPVADRERMLWLAEKSAELAATSWRPVSWRRSKSVSPRGEGQQFGAKVTARMAAALTQCEGAWLPDRHPDATLERAIAAAPPGTRLLLDVEAPPLLAMRVTAPVTIAVGPEGGMERDERERLVAGGFVPVSLGGNVLRFETAAVAALAVVRAMLHAGSSADSSFDSSVPDADG